MTVRSHHSKDYDYISLTICQILGHIRDAQGDLQEQEIVRGTERHYKNGNSPGDFIQAKLVTYRILNLCL